MSKLIAKGTLKNNEIAELLEIIDNCPADQRKWDNDIIGYHITDINNLSEIKDNGIIAHSSKQKYDRPECTYLFLDDVDADNVKVLIGDVAQVALLTVKIPAQNIGKLKFDGLYNISFDFGYGASMYFDSVPAEWIISADIITL